MIDPTKFKARCETCEMREACQFTFGAFWKTCKSCGGIGCNHPLSVEKRDAILAAKRETEAAKARGEKPRYGSHIEPIRIKATEPPPTSHIYHKFYVAHDGREYATAARSDGEAINNVRFKLYGRKPIDDLPPFAARRVTSGQKINKLDALARLKKMAK